MALSRVSGQFSSVQLDPELLLAVTIQDPRLFYYLITKDKTWLNINHITVHNNAYFIF